MDFGLARIARGTQVTKEGMTMGTIAYMSPEQARGEGVDHRTDIWSLGVVLYEMFTGQLPFKGEYDQAVVYSILNEKSEPITSLRTEIPVSIEEIVAKALEKDPDDRYQNIDELLEDRLLSHFGEGYALVRTFDAGLDPALFLRVGDMHELYTDGRAIGTL